MRRHGIARDERSRQIVAGTKLVAPPYIHPLFPVATGGPGRGGEQEGETTSIVLVEDNADVRATVRALLEDEPGLAVIGEADCGRGGVELVARLKPDVLVLDLMLGDASGLDVAREVRECSPATRVVVLTIHQEMGYVVKALEGGARGYVLKESAAEELPRAVREIAAGRLFLGSPLSLDAVNAYRRRAGARAPEPHHWLTLIERDVLRLSAAGRTDSEIAAELGLAERAVASGRRLLMSKLGLATDTDLVRYAVRYGLLGGDQAAHSPDGPPP